MVNKNSLFIVIGILLFITGMVSSYFIHYWSLIFDGIGGAFIGLGVGGKENNSK